MKAGFNLLLWTTHLTDDLLPVCERLKAMGYDGVEVPVFEGEPAHYEAIGRRLAEMGLRRTVVGIVGDPAANPSSEDPATRQKGADHLAWLVDCSAALGAEVVCGPFTQPLAVFSGAGATEGEWAALVESHRAMAERAADAGITLAVEPLNRFECYILNTADQAARLVAEVGAANYGYLYDTFHFNIEEKDIAGAATRTAGAIAHVHVSENDRGVPGTGHVPFAEVFAALKAGGYDGWLTVEAFGQALPDLAAATRVWRPLFDDAEDLARAAHDLIRAGWTTD